MKIRIIGGLLAAGGLIAAGLVAGGQYESESDERKEQSGFADRFGFGLQDVAPVQNALYRQECGDCHFAYQPGLLPAASWQKLMDNLADHFGENAELDANTAVLVRRYLEAGAADQVYTGRSRSIANSLRGAVPLRITETLYFRRRHEEIPPRAALQNPEVGSFSRCEACHTRAAEGIYNEHTVRIPGWDGRDD
jgi:hypothetical protein